jgi:hypothetical protein
VKAAEVHSEKSEQEQPAQQENGQAGGGNAFVSECGIR